MNEYLGMAGFSFMYEETNGTLLEENKLDRKSKFLSEPNRLDSALDT